MPALFKKRFTLISILFVIIFFTILYTSPLVEEKKYSTLDAFSREDNSNGKWRKLTNEQISNLSVLGEILYLDRATPKVDLNKNYTILVWRHGPILEKRHIKRYSNNRFDPFEKCSVRNCKLTYRDKDIEKVDLVLFHLHKTRSPKELPIEAKNAQQIWTFLTDESPFHTFLYRLKNRLKDYNGLFNWSMSYRMDSDIPVPYGRAKLLDPWEKPKRHDTTKLNKIKKQDVPVAIVGSNCGGKNHRWEYVRELEKYIPVHKYGRCGNLKCAGHVTAKCDAIKKYKFYLSFENSNCDEYVTEKVWLNAYANDAIPIVMGTSRKLYDQLLPPDSFLDVHDFSSPRTLANYMQYLNRNPRELDRYFEWKKHFKVLNEHGYFGTNSYHYCRICEALNYNDKKQKVYTDLEGFWITNRCNRAWDESR